MNNITIDGKICNKREYHTPTGKVFTTFSLNFYAGKKGDKAMYDFIDCKTFNTLNVKDKDKVSIEGYLSVDTWERDGKQQKKIVIVCNKVTAVDVSVANNNQISDDVIPF